MADNAYQSTIDNMSHRFRAYALEPTDDFDITIIPQVPQNTVSFSNDYGEPTPTVASQDGIAIISNGTVTSLAEYGLDVSITYSYILSDIVVGSIGPVGTATMERYL